MTFGEIKERLQTKFDEQTILSIQEDIIQPCCVVLADKLVAFCQFLRDDQRLLFDFLGCLTGIDNGIEANTVEVIYHFYSIPFQHSLVVKVIAPRQNPIVPTLSHLWRTADWHERECYDLVGIVFDKHPDLQRILLPDDWEGHPLRKDYQEQEVYHGIVVKY